MHFMHFLVHKLNPPFSVTFCQFFTAFFCLQAWKVCEDGNGKMVFSWRTDQRPPVRPHQHGQASEARAVGHLVFSQGNKPPVTDRQTRPNIGSYRLQIFYSAGSAEPPLVPLEDGPVAMGKLAVLPPGPPRDARGPEGLHYVVDASRFPLARGGHACDPLREVQVETDDLGKIDMVFFFF